MQKIPLQLTQLMQLMRLMQRIEGPAIVPAATLALANTNREASRKQLTVLEQLQAERVAA